MNLVNHQVSFQQAATVFLDPLALTLYDEAHSTEEEDRWITIGQAKNEDTLVVVHTYRERNDQSQVTLRIITARKATPHEIKQYEEVPQ